MKYVTVIITEWGEGWVLWIITFKIKSKIWAKENEIRHILLGKEDCGILQSRVHSWLMRVQDCLSFSNYQ